MGQEAVSSGERAFRMFFFDCALALLRTLLPQKFYWNGVKLINTNRLRVGEMQARVKAGGPPLTRWETRFIANYKRDALK